MSSIDWSTCASFLSFLFWSSLALAGSKAPVIRGYVDMYEQLSHQAQNPQTGPDYLNGRVFDDTAGQLVFNMVQISISKKAAPVGFHIDLGAGPMTDALAGNGALVNGQPASSDSQEPTRNFPQAIISFRPQNLKELTISAGKFYSPMGFESTLARDDWQYSRSLLYNYAIPFWHEGISFRYEVIPRKFTSTIQILNNWDGQISGPAPAAPIVALKLGWFSAPKFSLHYVGMYGPSGSQGDSIRQIHELNWMYRLMPKFTIAMDSVLGFQQHAIASSGRSAEWWAIDLYLTYSLLDWYTVSARFEDFDDSDQGYALSGFDDRGGIRQEVSGVTLSNNFVVEKGLQARLEYRIDRSNKFGFFKNSDGVATHYQQSVTAAVLYSF